MSDWTVVYADEAKRDLRDIFEYIAMALGVPDTAKRLAQRIMSTAESLAQFPLRHPLCENRLARREGVRYVAVGNYIVFYLPREQDQTVLVVRIMYSGRDIEAELRRTDNHQ